MDFHNAAIKGTFLDFDRLGEAMRPENLRGEAFRLSREERDHIAGHALKTIADHAYALAHEVETPRKVARDPSIRARQITALSNLLGDIGWEREGLHAFNTPTDEADSVWWSLGELFPVAHLRPWLEEWQRQDDKALADHEVNLEVAKLAEDPSIEPKVRQAIADAQTKVGTGAILLARIEKWMASYED